MAARHRSALMRPAARVLLPALLFGLATVAADTPEKPDDSDRQDSARTAPAAEAAGTADKGEKAEPAEKAEKGEKAEKDEKDEKADSDQAPLSLTVSQQQAVGIRIEQPLPLRSAPPIEAYGTVLRHLQLQLPPTRSARSDSIATRRRPRSSHGRPPRHSRPRRPRRRAQPRSASACNGGRSQVGAPSSDTP